MKVVKGDITEMDVDAIVNAANNRLWMGGGVAGAIKRKGGVVIEKEAMSKGPIPVGEAVVTRAGTLKARYVIHAAGMGTNLKTDEQKIRAATRNALKRASELHLRSVAFPSIGTGVGGFPYERAASAMIDEVRRFTDPHPEEVIFVMFTEEGYKAFHDALMSVKENEIPVSQPVSEDTT